MRAGVVHGIRHAARAMKASGTAGVILNTSSVGGLRATYASAAYTASKTALVALTQLAAAELSPSGIRCNAVAPGITATPMIAAFMLGNAEAPPHGAHAPVPLR